MKARIFIPVARLTFMTAAPAIANPFADIGSMTVTRNSRTSDAVRFDRRHPVIPRARNARCVARAIDKPAPSAPATLGASAGS